jgi:AcrR family transcriptional regulator
MEGLKETWASRELPILRSAVRRMDAGEYLPSLEDIRADAGLAPDQMRAGLRALEDAFPPYLATQLTMSGPETVGGHVKTISERARREVGTWPSGSELVDQLVAALEAQASDSADPERQSRLRGAAMVIGGMAREVAVAVLAKHFGA